MPRPSVQNSVDLERIRAIPRRVASYTDAQVWSEVLTPEFLLPKARGTLKPWQAYCLAEAMQHGGLVAGLPVGEGKTLLSYLLPIALNSHRSLLLQPSAGLRDKTSSDFRSYVGTWRTPSPPPQVWTLQSLAPEIGEHKIAQLRPTLIMVDESDAAANISSSAVRRIIRYVRAERDAGRVVYLCFFTGTLSRKSIMGYWHQLHLALRENAPMPEREGEAQMWAAALDDWGLRNSSVGRPSPGPLGRTIKEAREWFQRRLIETPGVVIVDGDSCDRKLTINIQYANEDPGLDAHYERFLTQHEDPEGTPVSDPLSRWRIDGQLGCGLYQKYVDPPPIDWREARRALASFVRDEIDRTTYAARPLDTEAQVIRHRPDDLRVQAWLAVKDTFTPVTRATWVTSSTIESVREWLAESRGPSVVWCGSVEFGAELAEVARLPYYTRKGRDQNGRALHDADPRRSLIASWHANMRGFNLQAWNRAAIVLPPQSAKYLEQIFGRHHRSGQLRDVVFTIFATSGGTLDAFASALSEARFAQSTTTMTQKILRAEINIPPKPRETITNVFRWATRQ